MNILITSVGRRSYMVEYFKDALTENDKVFAINNEKTYAMTLADHYEVCPAIYDESYIDFILAFCLKNNVTAIISLFDIDLPILAKNKSLFDQHSITLIISEFSFIETCNDKWLTYKFLTENNFRTPDTYLSLEKVKAALSSDELCFPLIVKPRWGMGSLGIFFADNEEDLDFYYKKTFETIQNSYLKFESQIDLENAVIIQEKLSGDEYGLDIHNSLKGDYIATVPKKKVAMRAGETDIAQVILDEKLINFGNLVANQTRHIGNLDVDLFIVSGEIYILELNARFGGQYPFSHLAGVNFPKVIVDQLENRPINNENITFSEITGSKDFTLKKI